jgi:hypothetical protein
MKKVNDIGMAALKTWIIETAKEDHCGVDQQNLEAWAQEAEASALTGRDAYVEMSKFSTRSGNPETFEIPDAGLTEHPEESDRLLIYPAHMKQPQNQLEALTLALYLSVTAPTDEKSAAAQAVAEDLTRGLSEIEVMRCKKDAEKLLSNQND